MNFVNINYPFLQALIQGQFLLNYITFPWGLNGKYAATETRADSKWR